MNETWGHNFSPKTKKHSMQWTIRIVFEEGEDSFICRQSDAVCFFSNACGIIFIDDLQKGKQLKL